MSAEALKLPSYALCTPEGVEEYARDTEEGMIGNFYHTRSSGVKDMSFSKAEGINCDLVLTLTGYLHGLEPTVTLIFVKIL